MAHFSLEGVVDKSRLSRGYPVTWDVTKGMIYLDDFD